MSYANYDDVMQQLHDGGLVVESVEVGVVRRCKVDGEREKRGWYALHELRLSGGDLVLVGSFGIWRGDDNNATKVELRKTDLSREQKDALRARIKADRQQEEARRRRDADRAAARARGAWAKCSPTGACDYLARKGLDTSYGARFTDRGNLVVPIMDTQATIHGLQIIYGNPAEKKRRGRDKDYWPTGMIKQGRFFLIGAQPSWVLLVAEGFATAASLHAATGHPVAVAFDAGNLLPVATALHKRYPRVRILICADDDYLAKCPNQECGALEEVAAGACPKCSTAFTHGNTGSERAQAAALAVGGAWIAPRFSIDRGKKKLTDFNDLHTTETLVAVGSQVDAAIRAQGWASPPVRVPVRDSGARGKALSPVNSTPELFERFAIIYGHNKALFDFQERILVSLDDMKLACSGREIWKGWLESDEKKIVRVENVGFDPAEVDPLITCNLFNGWPVEAKQGTCDELLAILEYLCSAEQNHRDLYHWILKWLAYPLQHPGAKMKTALLFHGPQRVGKNFFFECYMNIFGHYGQVIDQDALEDKYNDCFSRKLFLVADEVIARQEMYHVKNKLKGMITGTRIRINPKNVKSYWESNHCNIIFLSNETMPLVLERDDGRFVVVWTPPKLGPEFYKRVEEEVKAGSVAALYHYLLNLDLGDFGPHTPPPMTTAKRELMDLSMDSTERFWIEWSDDRIAPVPCLPVKSTQLYAFYREWCGRCGYPRYAPEPRFLAEISKRTGAKKIIGRYFSGAEKKQATFIVPPGQEQPPDSNQPEWLGRCVGEFSTGVTEWRSEHDENRH